MKKYLIVFLTFFIQSMAMASTTKIQVLNWNGLEIVWLEDGRFPTYSMQVYFGDGAISDDREKGETEMMFRLLDAGTRRFSHEDIVENLEFYGVQYGPLVTHEYSTYSVSGLVKDIVPTMKKICHLFSDSTFPHQEIEKRIKREVNERLNMVNNHSSIATNSFRELSLEGSPFAYPVEGKMSDWKKIGQKGLKAKLNYFNDKVYKRIYIAGPKSILKIQQIISNECGWKGEAQYQREITDLKNVKRDSPRIVLVSVPKSNQAQVRIGRFLNKGEFEDSAKTSILSHFLGGGFTSKLIQELRVKRGLTYSAGAAVSGQKVYGRAVINTFTKNNSLVELLDKTFDILASVGAGGVEDEEFERTKLSLAGSFNFRFENRNTYLTELMHLDHVGKNYDEIYNFRKNILNLKKDGLTSTAKNIFELNKQTIVVVGPVELKKELQKYGKVEIISYKKFL